MKIPLGTPFLKKDIILKELEKVVDSRWISGGPTIQKFENAIKEYNKDPDGHYIALSNGTVAIELALLAVNEGLRYKKNDEVIVPSWSWVASGFSPLNVGAKSVWCDVNQYGVAYAEDIEKRITKKTKAVIVVHQMGIPCDMDKINDMAKKYKIPVIEDAACAIGSEYKGLKIGNSKNIVTYSFQARKVLTTGEGGMIIVRNEKDAEWLRSMRAFGTNTSPLERDRANYLLKENFDKIGSNHKMSDISAAVGLAHLSYIDEEIELRKQVALYYDKLLTENYLSQGKVELATVIPDYCTKCNYQNYHIILDWVYMRDSIVDSLRKKEIGSKWDIQCTHLEPSINSKEKLEQSEKFHKRGMWLPFFAEITRDQQDIVVQNLKTILHESHQSM